MTKNNFLIYAPKVLLIIAWEIIYFPIWWYGPGFARTALSIFRFIGQKFISLGLGVWLKNLFVPMYGQHDFAGRFISFLVRLVQIVFRGLGFLFFVVTSLLLLFAWLLLPLLLLYGIFHQIIIG